MIRIVVDINVYVSALHASPREPPAPSHRSVLAICPVGGSITRLDVLYAAMKNMGADSLFNELELGEFALLHALNVKTLP